MSDLDEARRLADQAVELYNKTLAKLEIATEALKFYANESEWYTEETRYPTWKLNFNSGEVDAHGYSVAKEALNKIKKGE